MTRLPRRLLKLGGSLLDWPALRTQFDSWRTRQPPAEDLLLAGGGRLADVIRELDRVHGLSAATAHWLAIGAMSLNAEFLAALWPEAARCRSLSVWPARAASPALVVLDPWSVLDAERSNHTPESLPESWDVTSDSIAAWLAVAAAADELVLLKSSLPRPRQSRRDAASGGYIDPFFPRAAAAVAKVRCVNLRDPDFSETILPA